MSQWGIKKMWVKNEVAIKGGSLCRKSLVEVEAFCNSVSNIWRDVVQEYTAPEGGL